MKEAILKETLDDICAMSGASFRFHLRARAFKPIDVENFLKMIRGHLKKQQEAKEYNEEKVTEFIETRVRELEKENVVHEKAQ